MMFSMRESRCVFRMAAKGPFFCRFKRHQTKGPWNPPNWLFFLVQCRHERYPILQGWVLWSTIPQVIQWEFINLALMNVPTRHWDLIPKNASISFCVLHSTATLPEASVASENRPSQKEISSSNHWLLGRTVGFSEFKFQDHFVLRRFLQTTWSLRLCRAYGTSLGICSRGVARQCGWGLPEPRNQGSFNGIHFRGIKRIKHHVSVW